MCHQSQSISTFRTLPTIDISCFHSGQQKDSQHDEHSPQHDAPSQPLDVFEQEASARTNSGDVPLKGVTTLTCPRLRATKTSSTPRFSITPATTKGHRLCAVL